MSEDLTLKIDLDAPATLRGVLKALRAFAVWWARELSELLPESWRATLWDLTRSPCVVFEADAWRLENSGTAPLRFSLAAAPLSIHKEISAGAASVFRRSVDVSLLRSDGLFKRIRLPGSAATKLRQVVRLQLDRLSPFRGDDVHFDCYIVEPENPTPNLEQIGGSDLLVEVAIIPKCRLLEFERKLREVGLVPRAFYFQDTPARLSTVGLPFSKSTQGGVIAICAGIVLFAAANLLGTITYDNEAGYFKNEIDSIAPQVQRALAERDELVRYQLPTQALSQDRALPLDLVLDLTKRFPDEVYLTRLDISGSRVEIEGRTHAAASIKSLLASSPLLANVRVTENPSNGSFSVSAIFRSHAIGELK